MEELKKLIDLYYEKHMEKKEVEELEKQYRQQIIDLMPELLNQNENKPINGNKHTIIAKRKANLKLKEEVCKTSTAINDAIDNGMLPEVKRTFAVTLSTDGFRALCAILRNAGRADLLEGAEMHYELTAKTDEMLPKLNEIGQRTGLDPMYFLEDTGKLSFYPEKS